MPITQKAWLTLTKSGDLDAALPQLFEAKMAELVPRIAALAKLDPDPRVARTLTDAVCEPPFSSTSSRKFWIPLFDLLDEIGDADTLSRLAPLVPTYDHKIGAVVMGPWMKTRLGKLVTTLEGRLGPAKPAKPAAKKSIAKTKDGALLADILEHPDDDAPRTVLADLLLERGDPRGEFIALQLARTRNAAREQELINAHREQWLGPLFGIFDREVWERGFLASGRVIGHPAAKVARTAGAPEWGTVRELECIGSRPSPLAVIVHPIMRALRTITGIQGKSFVGLATGSPVPVTKIETYYGDTMPAKLPSADITALADAPGLPSLVELRIGEPALSNDELGRFDFFWRGALARRLEHFVFEASDVASWIVHLVGLRLTAPRRVVISEHDADHYELSASRDGGTLDHLAIRSVINADRLVNVLDALPLKLVGITYDCPTIKTATKVHKRVLEALARHQT